MQEKTLVAHMCERKRRALQQDEKRVQAGFMVYNRFYQLTQNAKKNKTYDNFADSSYYNAFVKFGSYINNVNPIYPQQFIDYVIKSGAKLDHWCRDDLYERYLIEMLKTEPVESAIQRTLQRMMEWADEHNAQFQHYFNYATTNRIVHDFLNGYITPWLILNCSSGQKALASMSDEQLQLIAKVFDAQFWARRFKENPADVILVKEVCAEADIN